MPKRPLVVILDDESERRRAMAASLSRDLPRFSVIAFDNAPEMIDWLRDHLEEACLICLDHDLGPNRLRDGQVFDPGTGRDVADYLSSRAPVCPVLIHTTNSLAAPGMILALADSGWPHTRVVPHSDLEWISADWSYAVRSALAKEGCD